MRKIGYIASGVAAAMLATGVASWGRQGTVETRENVTCMKTYNESGKTFGKFAKVLPESNADRYGVSDYSFGGVSPKTEDVFTAVVDSDKFKKGQKYESISFFKSNLFGDDRVVSSELEDM